MGKQWKQCQTLFFGAPKSLQMVIASLGGKLCFTLCYGTQCPQDPSPGNFLVVQWLRLHTSGFSPWSGNLGPACSLVQPKYINKNRNQGGKKSSKSFSVLLSPYTKYSFSVTILFLYKGVKNQSQLYIFRHVHLWIKHLLLSKNFYSPMNSWAEGISESWEHFHRT